MKLAPRMGGLAVLTALLALAVALFVLPYSVGWSPRAGASTMVPAPTVDEPAGSRLIVLPLRRVVRSRGHLLPDPGQHLHARPVVA